MLQNIHNKGFMCKILIANNLAPGVLPGAKLFLICIHYSWLGGTNTPRDFPRLARVLVGWGLDKSFRALAVYGGGFRCRLR